MLITFLLPSSSHVCGRVRAWQWVGANLVGVVSVVVGFGGIVGVVG